MKRIGLWSLALLGSGFAIGFGLWSQSLFTKSELMHFSVNFPSEGRAETMSCCNVGGPWAREHGDDWNDYPAGGLLAYGDEGALVVDVGQQGLIKRTLQPGLISISSHWLRNVGTQPYRIRLEMDMCELDMEWLTFEANWDQETQASTRLIEPGDTFNMDWFFHIPVEQRNQEIVCAGELRIIDADTGNLLTDLPVKIVNSQAY
ncbi:MAG: hypothetical protein P8129_15865 [Anaerolineae bacterium]